MEEWKAGIIVTTVGQDIILTDGKNPNKESGSPDSVQHVNGLPLGPYRRARMIYDEPVWPSGALAPYLIKSPRAPDGWKFLHPFFAVDEIEGINPYLSGTRRVVTIVKL